MQVRRGASSPLRSKPNNASEVAAPTANSPTNPAHYTSPRPHAPTEKLGTADGPWAPAMGPRLRAGTSWRTQAHPAFGAETGMRSAGNAASLP